MSDYPEHDKLHAVVAETQAAGEFIEWLESKGIFLAEYEPGWSRPMAINRSVVGLLAEWTDIDQNKIEAEKRQMLAVQRALNEKA